MDEKLKELILLAKQGDENAFYQLYQKYYHRVFKRAYQLSHNEADAKDIAQEAFITASKGIKNLQEVEAFSSWLMLIVSSRASDLFRKNKFAYSPYDNIENSMQYTEERNYMEPQKYADNASEMEILLKIIETMSKKQAEIVKLFFFEERKQTEIAEILHIPLGTVKTRMARARKELKERIEEYEQVEGRKLSFRVDMIIPASTSIVSLLIAQCGSQGKHVMTLAQSHMAVSVTVVGVSVAAAVGVINGLQEKANTVPQTQSQLINTFPTLTYYDKDISSSKDAYYMCMNFALDEEMMKQRTKEEFEDLLPVVESLRASNSFYFQQLQSSGWIHQFELFYQQFNQ